MVHFYRILFSHVPKAAVKACSRPSTTQESLQKAQGKATDVIASLKVMKLPKGAALLEEAIEKMLTYCGFPVMLA